jgi:chaperone modulatory protein CbpM
MDNEMLISVIEFCRYHDIDMDFIQSLEQSGLIETQEVQQAAFVHADNLRRLEKFVRLHQELNLPADSLDIVSHLLNRLEGLQHEINQLKNRLGFYERLENNPKQAD